MLGGTRSILEGFWSLLGTFWAHHGASWESLGRVLGSCLGDPPHSARSLLSKAKKKQSQEPIMDTHVATHVSIIDCVLKTVYVLCVVAHLCAFLCGFVCFCLFSIVFHDLLCFSMFFGSWDALGRSWATPGAQYVFICSLVLF